MNRGNGGKPKLARGKTTLVESILHHFDLIFLLVPYLCAVRRVLNHLLEIFYLGDLVTGHHKSSTLTSIATT